jgi:hypothetical protein
LVDGLYCHGVNRFYSARLLKQETFRFADYPQMADRELYVRIGLRGVRKVQSADILYHFLVHPGSNTTGGSAEKVVSMLDETSRIAQQYLGRADLSSRERGLLLNWYCFNRLRMCLFLVKCGRPLEACACGAVLAVRYPLRAMRNAMCWRIPKALRPKPVQAWDAEQRHVSCITFEAGVVNHGGDSNKAVSELEAVRDGQGE